MACDVLRLSSMMNFFGRAPRGENLETDFSQALQRGVAKATRGVKGMQQVFRQRRGSGGKIIGPIPSLLSTKIHRDAFWCPCLFILLHDYSPWLKPGVSCQHLGVRTKCS